MRLIHVRFALPVIGAMLALAPSCFAASFTGSVWENATSFPSTFPNATPAGSPTATFTISGTGNAFNFDSFGNLNDTGNGSLDYTLGTFLTSGGDTVTYGSLASSAVLNDSINNDVFEFKGVTFLTANTVYSLTHDDGMYLNLTFNGMTMTVINSGSPTAADASSFTVGTSGLYSFDLLYAEVNGAPGELNGNLGSLSPTPEPSSLMLLGTGLAGVARMVRRRLVA